MYELFYPAKAMSGLDIIFVFFCFFFFEKKEKTQQADNSKSRYYALDF